MSVPVVTVLPEETSRTHMNIEFYAGNVMEECGVPPELSTPTFASSRVIGWTAHVLAQAADNRLIRPSARYAGPTPPELGPGPRLTSTPGMDETAGSALEGASVLVTGGAGFIGSHLVRALLRAKARVTVLEDLPSGDVDALDGVRLVRGDVRDRDALREAVSARPKYVFHLAAKVSVHDSIRDPIGTRDVNVTGTLRVLEAAAEGGARRFVYSSSTAVYGETEILPIDEDTPTRPLSPYGASKLEGESHVLAGGTTAGLGTIALRYFNVFGPGQSATSAYAAAIPRFIHAYLRGDAPSIYGDGEQTRDFVFVDDVVRANLLATVAPERAMGRAYNVATGVARSVNDRRRRHSA